MRFGFFVGFLIGAAIASLYTLAERAEAPAGADVDLEHATPQHVVDKLAAQARTAKLAAEEAAKQKEEEMRREYEETLRRATEHDK
jgi:hypothetical protein